MRAFSLKYAQENLEYIARETIDNDEETVITLDSGKAVVIISLDRWESDQETQYLLSHPANRKHLLESIDQYRTGQIVSQDLIDP